MSHGLAPLLDRIPDETHAAEFAGDENARHIGLEVRPDQRNINAALRRAEDQRDGAARTGGFAGSVTYAVRWFDKLGLAVDEAQNIALWTKH